MFNGVGTIRGSGVTGPLLRAVAQRVAKAQAQGARARRSRLSVPVSARSSASHAGGLLTFTKKLFSLRGKRLLPSPIAHAARAYARNKVRRR